jgi:Holliday junction resolvase RusA-like endonuclease
MKLDIKPLSINEAFQGRRFKTEKYNRYEKAVLLLLPKLQIPEPPLKLSLVFGFSNIAADLDNPAKLFIDCMQKKYGFNDKHIFELNIRKEVVKKGAEFIGFQIDKVD